jgi:hypothetical protein
VVKEAMKMKSLSRKGKMRLAKILMICLCGLFLVGCASEVKPTVYHITGNKYIIAFNKTSHVLFPEEIVKIALLKKAAKTTLKNGYSYFVSNITSKRTYTPFGKDNHSYHWEVEIRCLKTFSMETAVPQELQDGINEALEEGYSAKEIIEFLVERGTKYGMPEKTISEINKGLEDGYSPIAILRAILQVKMYQDACCLDLNGVYNAKDVLETYK